MKHLALALLIGVAAAPVFAIPCVALDYQEMKDMPADDLTKEACKAIGTNDLNFQQYLLNIESRGPKPFPEADRDYDVCKSQIDRMTRVINSKGVTEKLPALCKRQAQGEVITAAPEAK